MNDIFAVFHDDNDDEGQNQIQKNVAANTMPDNLLETLDNERPLAKILIESAIYQESEKDENDNFQSLPPRTKSYTVFFEPENCTHEVVVPNDVEYDPIVTKTTEPAKRYDFPLDEFQKQALKCVDNNKSVLVSAHTSAGKTVVALYAIAMAMRDKQKVVYTSPIKALSNQKYRELSDEFEDVGLITGDVTLNPNASCLVMTTEILRSMLYRGSEITREVGWVIFDEIHYMRDKERGVVWEETIILLPDPTHYVFLSATIPNAKQFAEWISYLHHQQCHVVYTDRRPVPLQHLIYTAGSEGLYEVVDIKGKFRDDNFKKAMNFLSEAGGTLKEQQKARNRKSGGSMASNVVKIIRTIKERELLPCIVFSFSRRECEAYANELKNLDLNSDEEKKAIREIYTNAISLLSDEDKKLPQIANILPNLLRGIGVHHSGLFPMLKEVTEILFGEGLIKTLFATETFSMGINMPAKTVIFTSVRKFDGTKNREITSGEYIQMSGRAGRRGKDEKGLVILMIDEQISEESAKKIIKGESDPINSQFRLTYNMVLNLLRVPDINPQYMLEKSFYQFQNYASLPELHNKLKDKERELEMAPNKCLIEIEGYYNLEQSIESLKETIKNQILKPKHIVPFFQQGRLFKLSFNGYEFGWVPLIKYEKKPNPQNPLSPDLMYFIHAAVPLSKESAHRLRDTSQARPPQKGQRGQIEVLAFAFDAISAVSKVRLKIPQELKTFEAKQSVGAALEEIFQRFKNHLPELDPIENMKISDETLIKNIKQLDDFTKRYNEHPVRNRSDFQEIYNDFKRRISIQKEYQEAKKNYSNAQKLVRSEELRNRKRVLRRLQYATDEDTITDKGRVACELSSADELLLTEMIFTGVFTELTPQSAAALLSCMVFQEKVAIGKLEDTLSGYLRNMQNYAKKIAKISNECKVEVDEHKYIESFCPGLMNVVYQWCSGATFKQILEDTDIFEGSIIRCMRRLEELLQEMIMAAKSFNDETLIEKFQNARILLKRDIVFSASLYL